MRHRINKNCSFQRTFARSTSAEIKTRAEQSGSLLSAPGRARSVPESPEDNQNFDLSFRRLEGLVC
eukprot:489128-Prymnesium_polylepis.1